MCIIVLVGIAEIKLSVENNYILLSLQPEEAGNIIPIDSAAMLLPRGLNIWPVVMDDLLKAKEEL